MIESESLRIYLSAVLFEKAGQSEQQNQAKNSFGAENSLSA